MKIQQKKYSATSGWEILNTRSFDSHACNLVLVFGSTAILENSAISFEKTIIKTAAVQIAVMATSYRAGNSLALALDIEVLNNVLIISDGIIITGGLAGDGARFNKTLK